MKKGEMVYRTRALPFHQPRPQAHGDILSWGISRIFFGIDSDFSPGARLNMGMW